MRQPKFRDCPACGETWRVERHRGASKLCLSCTGTHRWCSPCAAPVVIADYLGGGRCRPCSKQQNAVANRRNREFMDAYKVASGCADCGYNADPIALDFDHLPGFKKCHAPSRLKNRTMDILLAEISKCEVRCANCHRIKTQQRREAKCEN